MNLINPNPPGLLITEGAWRSCGRHPYPAPHVPELINLQVICLLIETRPWGSLKPHIFQFLHIMCIGLLGSPQLHNQSSDAHGNRHMHIAPFPLMPTTLITSHPLSGTPPSSGRHQSVPTGLGLRPPTFTVLHSGRWSLTLVGLGL